VLCCSFFARIYLAVVSCLFLSLRFGDAVALPSGRRAIHRRRHTFTGKSSALPLLKTALASSAKAVCVTFFSQFQIDEELSSVTSPFPSFPRRPNFSALLLSATSSGLLFLKLLDCFSKEVAGEMRSIFSEAPQPPAVAAALLRFFFSTLQRLSDFLTTQQLCLNLRASETRMIPPLLVLFMLHTRMLMIFVSLLHLQLGLEDVFTSQAQRASKSSSPSSAEHPLPVILLFDRGVCDVSGVTQSPFFKLFFATPISPLPHPHPHFFTTFSPLFLPSQHTSVTNSTSHFLAPKGTCFALPATNALPPTFMPLVSRMPGLNAEQALAR